MVTGTGGGGTHTHLPGFGFVNWGTIYLACVVQGTVEYSHFAGGGQAAGPAANAKPTSAADATSTVTRTNNFFILKPSLNEAYSIRNKFLIPRFESP
jgi:hypothetical protein